MTLILVYFVKVFLALSLTCPYNSTDNGAICICQNNFYLADSKVCVDGCPSLFTSYTESVYSTYTCIAPSGDNGILFALEFSKVQDLSATFIASSSDPTEQFFNPNSVAYRDQSQLSPLPTLDRGFYFAQTSSATSVKNHIPGLYFTLNLWIKPLAPGDILNVVSSSYTYLRIWAETPAVYKCNAIIYNSQGELASITLWSDAYYTQNWHQASIVLNQAEVSLLTMTFYMNGECDTSSSWSAEMRFQSIPYVWTIGSASGASTFTGFIYWLQARSDIIVNYLEMTSKIECMNNQYWTGSDCQTCSSACPTWPWCVRDTDCSYCFTPDCSICSGYSLSMCTSCNTGIVPGCCDYLSQNCTQTWSNTNCINGVTPIQGICLNSIPYLLNLTNLTPPDSAVLTVDFNGPFAGTYNSVFVTGAIPLHYYFWSTPESIDPIPAKNRGLYFSSGKYLAGNITLSYTCSICMWVYAINGTIISHESNRFSINSNGSMNFTLEKWDGTTISVTNSNSIPSKSWRLICYSIGFANKATTITPFLDNIAGEPSTIANYIFRMPASGKLYLGKGQTNYTGFIAYFSLWQKAIGDFSDLTNVESITSGLITEYWPCDFSSYYNDDIQECQSCQSSCITGCTQGVTCDICQDPLCYKCSSFLAGTCSKCVPNTSGPPCTCISGFYEVASQNICSDCDSRCSSCSDSSYNSCTSCNQGYFLYSSICLINCPTGYSENSNSCAYSSNVALSINFYDQIKLDTIAGAQVGSDSTNTYPNYDSNDPIPSYLRGYYFTGATYLSTSIVISPYFTVSIWIRLFGYGIIFEKNVSGNMILSLEFSGLLLTLSFMLNDESLYSVTTSTVASLRWNFISFTGKIDSENAYTINSYINSVADNNYSVLTGSYFEDSINGVLFIGTDSNINNGFVGFLYNVNIFNAETHYKDDYITSGCASPCTVCPSDKNCLDVCSIHTYMDGTSCSSCMGSCKNGCRYTDTCLLCKTKQCDECDSFSGSCTHCITNAEFDGSGGCQCVKNSFWSSTGTCQFCDSLCSDCVINTSFLCNLCLEGKVLVGNICLKDCPFGYGSSCSATSDTVIDTYFDTDFSGSYGVFTTGTSADTFQPFSSPELYDPIPAMGRGLYFNGNMYLLSSVPVYLSYTFSIGIWFHSIMDGDFILKQWLLVSSTGTVKLWVKNTDTTTAMYILSTSSSITGWTYFSFCVSYESGSTSLILYLNGMHDTSASYADQLFRDKEGNSLQLGKSDSSGFIGFIYNFQLWNSYNSFFNITNTFTFCGINQFASCLWTCDISGFNNTNSCSSCNSCPNGCVRVNDCNLCDDPLCALCTGFGTEKCGTCVANAMLNSDSNLCECSQGYYVSGDGTSCLNLICFAGCQTCIGTGFYQCSSCTSGYYLLNNQCLTICPWGYSANGSTNNCDSTEMQTMTIKFSNKILLDTCMGWNVGSQSTNQYPDYDANDPYPAYLRGYYFLPDKYLTTNFVLPPTFSISIWINPISDGYIIGKYLSGITWYVKIEQGVPTFLLALSDPSLPLSTTLTSIINVLDSGWVFISFDCIIDANGITTINSYVNKNIILQASTLDNSVYPLDNVSGNIYIGHFMGGFTGFLWIVSIFTETNNALTDYMTSGCSGSCKICSADLSCPDNCPISAYFDGSSCITCKATAINGCRNSETSRLCQTKECNECTEFTGFNSCLHCITNAVGDGNGGCKCDYYYFWDSLSEYCELCDALCSTCLGSTYIECGVCRPGYQLIGNACLYLCPYGFGLSCSPIATPVIDISFNANFQGSYDIFNTGTSTASFYHFNNPESIDPIPAQGRGLYFNGQMYLQSSTSINLSHSFTIGAWIYVISNGDWFEKESQRLTLYSAGSVTINMETPIQDATVQNLPSGSGFTDWNYLGFTVEYAVGATTLVMSINDNSISYSFANQIYRDLLETNLIIGKSSTSGFVGFIKYFTLWNAPIYDFSSYINDILCGVSLGHSCLWSCDLSRYWDGNSYLACNSCTNGCVRAGTCNICYDQLCLTCTSFSSGSCTQCIFNASGAPNTCACNQGYYLSSSACIPCENFLNQNSVVASFNIDYSQILLTFSVAADASPACCSCLFDTTTLQSFGSGYSCSYATDYKSLTIVLSKGYTFSKENIVFLSGILKNSALVCGNPPSSFSVPVTLPSPIPTPSFIFSAPKTLSILCETLKLTAVIGNELPYEQFKWTFSSTPASSAISSYSTQYSSIYSDITIPKSSLTDSILSVTFSAKNNFGNIASVTQNINVTSSVFLNINFDTVPYTLISRLKSYSISISSITACTVSSSISVTWKIGQTSNNITSIDEVSLRGNQTSQYVLIIPPKVLPASSNITFIFHAKDLVNLSEGESSLTVQTDVSDPVILFNRTDGPTGADQDLLIDAGSSYDPDDKSQFSFQWLCLNDAADCSSFILNTSSSLMKISANSLSAGIKYNFTVILTKITLNPISTAVKVSKSIFITAQQGTVPLVNIIETGNSNFGIVNPELAYRIQAQGTFTSVLWSSKGNLPILFSSPLNYADLVITQNSLLAGSTYTLEALINQNFVFTWTFYVNQGPKGGSLSVTPSSGYEMVTQFTIEAINWVDPEDNIPIEYAFGYLISDNYQVISSKNLSSLIYSTFPYSSKPIMISVDVYDSLLSKITFFQYVTVSLQENSNVDQYIDDVKTQLNSPDLNPISIPKLVSDLSSLSLNRDYIVSGNYSAVDQQMQDSYNVAIDKITEYTQNTDPYNPSTYSTIFNMLKVITLNPSINSYDNIVKVSNVIKGIVSNLDEKVQLDDNQVQTFIDICNNNFQVNSSEVANQTDTISSIESNIKSISANVLNGMSTRENKLFLEDKISIEISRQPSSILSNFSSEIMGASIILASNTGNFVSNDEVGTSFILYDPISNGANASFSLVSFTLTDLSTHDAIPLNNTNYNYISIPVIFTNNSTNATINCTYLEEGQSTWKTDGCVLDSYNSTVIICKCSHLSIFSSFFGGASDTAQSSNIGETVNVNAFSNIDWDTNAIGLYFCAALLIFYIVLTMFACKLDRKIGDEPEIEKSYNESEEYSKKNDESTERSEDMTYRTDDSIVLSFRNKIGHDPSIQQVTQSSTQEMSRADSISSVQIENIDPKPKKKRMSFFEFVGRNHDFISIFLPDRLFSHSSRVTAYTISLLGNMFFIGLFYQNGEEESKDDGGSMNLSDTINNYSFRDFWVMVYSAGIMIPIIIILRTLAKRKIKENLDQEKQNKLKKREKWKTFAFYLISWSLMGYFCWSIILFSIQFQLNLTYKWICNTSISYGSDIFVMPFIKMPIKILFVWIFTKLIMALGFSSSKKDNK